MKRKRKRPPYRRPTRREGKAAKPPRFAPSSMFPHRPGLCRVCPNPVRGRRTFCSQACVGVYLTYTSGTGLRRAAFLRDKGVCRTCGLDCTALAAELTRWQKVAREIWRACRGALGVNSPWRKTFWDADHIKPVVDGGGSCGLGNVQTLCLWCHRSKTGGQQAVKFGTPPPSWVSGTDVVERELDYYRPLVEAQARARKTSAARRRQADRTDPVGRDGARGRGDPPVVHPLTGVT